MESRALCRVLKLLKLLVCLHASNEAFLRGDPHLNGILGNLGQNVNDIDVAFHGLEFLLCVTTNWQNLNNLDTGVLHQLNRRIAKKHGSCSNVRKQTKKLARVLLAHRHTVVSDASSVCSTE